VGRPVLWATLTCERCGAERQVKPYRLRAGRRFCSYSCSGRVNGLLVKRRLGAENANFKGDAAGRWAMHKRAIKIKPIEGPCERCPSPGQVIHHKDENPWNNDISNLELLCRSCHARHHAQERRKASADGGLAP
jgi:hypothetical protein